MNRKTQPKIKELSEINLLPLERTVLPNGIPLVVINSEEQDICRIDLLFGGGYWTQEKKLQAYFTNLMLREGTKKYTSAQLAEKFDFYGSSLELSLFSQYSYLSAYCLNKYFERTAELISSMIREASFPEKEFNILVNTELQKYQIKSTQAKYVSMRNLRNAFYGDSHPLGKRTTEEDYSSISIESLRHYFKSHYNSRNCHIILSGKITKEILNQTEKIFGTDTFGDNDKELSFPTYSIVTSPQKRIFEEMPNAQQNSIKLGMLSIDQLHPDFHNFNILITILGGYFGSRLMSNIREDKGFTYGIYSGFLHEPDSSMMIITTEASQQYTEPLIQEIYNEIDKLQNELVSKEELSIVRNYLTGTLCRTMELSFNVAEMYLLQFLNNLPDSFIEGELHATQTITPQEIQRLAQRYLCKENLKEVIAGKKNL